MYASRRWPSPLALAGLALRLAWVLYIDTIPLGGDPHVVFSGQPRYHVPLFPIFAISAAGGAWALAAIVRERLEALREKNAAV